MSCPGRPGAGDLVTAVRDHGCRESERLGVQTLAAEQLRRPCAAYLLRTDPCLVVRDDAATFGLLLLGHRSGSGGGLAVPDGGQAVLTPVHDDVRDVDAPHRSLMATACPSFPA